jgi:hypothetical protein
MVTLKGQCHCGNVQLDVELTQPPGAYQPRACDCEFCQKHGAAYISDPQGALALHVKDGRLLKKYRQGSGRAFCLLCTGCGVVVGAAYEEKGQTFAALNRRVVEGGVVFGAEMTVSPKALGVDEKIQRWKNLWFSRVALVVEMSAAHRSRETSSS